VALLLALLGIGGVWVAWVVGASLTKDTRAIAEDHEGSMKLIAGKFTEHEAVMGRVIHYMKAAGLIKDDATSASGPGETIN
jgi:hypothetical protein